MSHEVELLCIGHSHIACIEEASLQRRTALRAINFWHNAGSLYRDDANRWQLSASMMQLVEQHDGPIFSLVGGASYGVLGMLMHPRPWDCVLPDAPELPTTGAELIPYSAIRATLLEMMQEYLEITEQIARIARHGVFQIEPPPPFPDAERIAPHIPWDLYPGMQRVISPAPLRYKLWRLQTSLLVEHCSAHGIGFVRFPDASTDPQGYMAPGYFLDGAHANAAYGGLVLDQMRKIHEASL